MRLSHLLIRTEKRAPAEAELPSHQLTLRAGLARRVAAGIYTLTPLAFQVIQRIEEIIKIEMERLGGQQVLLPVVHPAELWRESGRYDKIDPSLLRLSDRNEHPMVLAMTHEEAAGDLVRAMVESYRQLPLMIFQMQTKFRDEPRPRAGLIRLREFLMKDAYSFHTTQDDLDQFYDLMVQAYQSTFARPELPVLVVQSDSGMMGGQDAHEFILLSEGGEDTLITCSECGYAANQEVAVAERRQEDPLEEQLPLDEVHTPGATSIADLSALMGCSEDQTLKAVFFASGPDVVLALIRGDLGVSETKLRRLLGRDIQPLSAEESAERGLAVGYVGPVGLKVQGKVTVVADDSVRGCPNLVAGANKPDYHLRNVNYGRDFIADLVGDIAVVTAEQPCVHCGAPLLEQRGIEIGNTFKLGTKYSDAMDILFTDENGVRRPIVMGCYGIGITRLLASIIEAHHDKDGIIWPSTVAPYPFHLLAAGKKPEVWETARTLYAELGEEKVLFDDRDFSIGVKLKDADLLGMPVRLTVSDRSLASGGVEIRLRRTGETQVVATSEAVAVAKELFYGLG